MSRPTLLGWLEATLNRLLALDPEAVAALEGLDGKVIHIAVAGTALGFGLHIHGRQVSLLRRAEIEPDASVSGLPGDLLRLLVRAREPEEAAGQRVEVDGDRAVLEALLAIIGRLDIDLEELASRAVGDIAAHQIGNWARAARAWARQAGDSTLVDVGEYLGEEARVVATSAELEALPREVERLREEVDGLERRVQRLSRKAAGRGG